MAIVDLYSKRQRRDRGEMPDVYVYDVLTERLRVQIIYIINDTLDKYYGGHVRESAYQHIKGILCREYGLPCLSNLDALVDYPFSDEKEVCKFFLKKSYLEQALDVIECFFKLINAYGIKINQHESSSNAISELNHRFKEHGVGYQFESNQIIRIDSELLHSEVTKPVLAFLRDENFKGANEEFLLAHEHYRHGKYKECLMDSLKAFESTMKIICTQRGWQYDKEKDSAQKLIKICFENELLPAHLDSQFSSLRGLLESVPTIRNKNAGHGQGADSVAVPEYLASYALHFTASTILFLIKANAAKN